MEPDKPIISAVSSVAKPRKPFRLTGARLGNRVQIAQALLRHGASQSKVAQDLGISRRSVGAIAKGMREGEVAAASGAPAEPSFEAYVKGDLQRVAKLSLQNITQEKAERANIRDLATVFDKSLGRLEAMEDRTGNNACPYWPLNTV